MKKSLFSAAAAAAFLSMFSVRAAEAACGCMLGRRPATPRPVAQRARILNEASKVAMVRVGGTTVMTMANDVKTEAHEFALVVPVPAKIGRDDVRVVSGAVFDRLDRLSSPRLVESWDPDPCPALDDLRSSVASSVEAPRRPALRMKRRPRAADYGVKVEAYYEVGEYEIAILKARRGGGLREWLNRFHYEIPGPAIPVLDSYIKQGNRFFVAKVNLRKAKAAGPRGFRMLRPLQVRFETPKFMLPVRLGMVNADGPQELVMYGFSDRGRIESTNYPMQRMPTGGDVPAYVKNDFEGFYKAIFDRQTKVQDMSSTFLEWTGPVRDGDLLTKLGHPWRAGTRGGSEQASVFIDEARIRVDGALTKRDVRRKLAGLQARMAKCEPSAPRRGRMVLDLEVQKNGRVTVLGLSKNTARDAKLRRCVLRQVSRWRLGRARGMTSLSLPVVSTGAPSRRPRRLSPRKPLYMTRLHFRYQQETFPADLAMQATRDREPFAVRFDVRHPARNTNCPAGEKYLAGLPARRAKEARRLVSLTGWDLSKVRTRMGLPADAESSPGKKTKIFPWW